MNDEKISIEKTVYAQGTKINDLNENVDELKGKQRLLAICVVGLAVIVLVLAGYITKIF